MTVTEPIVLGHDDAPTRVLPRRRRPWAHRLAVAAAALVVLVMLAAFLRTAAQEVLSPELLTPLFVVTVLVVGAAAALRAVPRPRLGPVEVLMAVYLGWVLLSLVRPHIYEAVDPWTGADVDLVRSVLRGVVLPFGIYVVARVALVEERFVRWLLWSVVAMTAYSAWVSVLPFHGPSGLAWPRFVVDDPSWPGRAVGVFDQPVTNGLLLVIGIAVCLLLAAWGELPRAGRVGLYGLAAAATYAVYLTHTRAALLGLAVAVLLGVAVARGSRRGFVAVGVVGGLALVSRGLSAVFSPDRDAGGFGSVSEIHARLNLVVTALDAIARHPLEGVGLGRFAMFNTYEHSAWSPSVNWSQGQSHIAHQNELGVAAELGVPGLVLWLGVLTGVVILVWRAARELPADRLVGAPLAVLAGIALAVMVANGATVDLRPLEFTTMLPFVLAGSVAGVLDRHRSPDRAPTRWPAPSGHARMS